MYIDYSYSFIHLLHHVHPVASGIIYGWMAEFHQNGGRKYLCSGGILPDLCLTSSAASYEYGMTQGLVISGRMLPEVQAEVRFWPSSAKLLPELCTSARILAESDQNSGRILFCQKSP